MNMDWLSLLGVFGLGSVVTTIVSNYLISIKDRKIKSFDERKEAYIGLLEAWVRQENNDFDQQSRLDVGHWVLRSELVASPDVYEKLQIWKSLSPDSDDRIKATESLKSSMRSDLTTQ